MRCLILHKNYEINFFISVIIICIFFVNSKAIAEADDYALGISLLEDNQPEKAIEMFDRVLHEDENNIDALLGKAKALEMVGNHAGSFLYYHKAYTRGHLEDTSIFNMLGKELLLSNPSVTTRINQAIGYYDKSLQIEPNNVDALNGKGKAINHLRNPARFNEAVELFDTALLIEPNNMDALNGKGNSLLSIKKPNQAIDLFDKVLSIEPNNVDALSGKGNAYFNLEIYGKAITYFNMALKLDPGNSVNKKLITQSFKNLSDEEMKIYDPLPKILFYSLMLVIIFSVIAVVIPILYKRKNHDKTKTAQL